jgi:hypothetical protein
MMPRGFIALAMLAAASTTRLAHACAGCSNPNLPSARSESSTLSGGELSAALSLTTLTTRVVHPESCPEIGPICNERAEPPQQHDQRFYVAELRPVLALGLTDVFSIELQAPLRVVSTNITFRRQDGTAFVPDYENIHHRDETLLGFADPWLSGRGGWLLGPVSLTARAGVALPIGSTEENPFARGLAGLSHEHIQFGTGTFHPVLAVDAGVNIAAVRVTGYAQTLLFLYENSRGYRAGNRYMGGVSADTLLFAALRGGLGMDAVNEQPERWDGAVQQDGNVGRTDILVGGNLSYGFDSFTASLSVKVPVYQHFLSSHHEGDPGQLTYPAVVSLGVQTTFGAVAQSGLR